MLLCLPVEFAPREFESHSYHFFGLFFHVSFITGKRLAIYSSRNSCVDLDQASDDFSVLYIYLIHSSFARA